MSGIPRGRMILYALAVLGLVAVNLVRLQDDRRPTAPVAVGVPPPIVTVPDLEVAGDLAGGDVPASRDLFRRPVERPVAPVEPPKPAAAPAPPPDPLQVARSRAAKTMEGIKLMGVLRGGDRLLAVVQHDGSTYSLAEGDLLAPGFVVGTISTNEVRIVNDRLGLTAVVILGGGEPTRILGMDG